MASALPVCHIHEVCKNGLNHSCRSWLVWKVVSSSLWRTEVLIMLQCHMTLIYVLVPKWPLLPKSCYFPVICQFVRKRFKKSKLLQWTASGKVGKCFLTTPKLPSDVIPSPHLIGWKHDKISKDVFFHLDTAVRTYVWQIYAEISKLIHQYTSYSDCRATTRLKKTGFVAWFLGPRQCSSF